jgi:hypothetical protein
MYERDASEGLTDGPSRLAHFRAHPRHRLLLRPMA